MKLDNLGHRSGCFPVSLSGPENAISVPPGEKRRIGFRKVSQRLEA